MLERAEPHYRQRRQSADEGPGCEAAVEDMSGEDGVGVALVFGVGGVGEKLRHPGVMEREEVVLVFGGGVSGV